MWDLSSLTRDWTHVPCIARQILNHWTTREVPRVFFCLSNLWSLGAFFYQFLKWHISFDLEFLELIDTIVSAFFLLNPSSGVYKIWGPLTSGLFIIFMVKVKVAQSCLTLCNPTDCTIHGTILARILEWVAYSLLQGIFPTQGLNSGLPHCRRILYQLSHQESPRTLEWVANPFSSRSSQPRNQTRVSCIAGRFFTSWATREPL